MQSAILNLKFQGSKCANFQTRLVFGTWIPEFETWVFPPSMKKPPLGGIFMDGAGNGIRTRDFQLGKLTLYQLSYARGSKNNREWRGVCKEEGER